MTVSERRKKIIRRKKMQRILRRYRKPLFYGAVALLLLCLVLLVRSAVSKRRSGSEAREEAIRRENLSKEQEKEAQQEMEATPVPSPTPTPEPYADKPDIDINDWKFILANPWHSVEEYEPDLEWFEDVQLDYRIIDAMDAFVGDARDLGYSVVMVSGYRSYDTQTGLFEQTADAYGEEEAATIVAVPGTSEHQTGLAADITDDYYDLMNESLENTELYQWMSAHCHEYGFIVRFPKGKEDITGIIYEPWHYRYVGVEAATYIMEHDLTLEEFLELYQPKENLTA
ncbi:MAG: M15 family metallopeptidase [Blautia sp.]|nr:M15 family metallopeptidase [Blautia sp.]